MLQIFLFVSIVCPMVLVCANSLIPPRTKTKSRRSKKRRNRKRYSRF